MHNSSDGFDPLFGGTVASNPMGCWINPVRWFLFAPLFPSLWLVLAVGSASLAILIHWGFWIAAGVFLLAFAFYWFAIMLLFRKGDTCPAVVVQENPPLLAAYVDLSMGGPPQWALRIFETAARSATGQSWRIGQRTITVCHYAPPADDGPCWSDVFPTPVDAGTGDQQWIESKMRTIPDADWSRLEKAVKAMPTPIRVGIHRLH